MIYKDLTFTLFKAEIFTAAAKIKPSACTLSEEGEAPENVLWNSKLLLLCDLILQGKVLNLYYRSRD